MIRFERKIVWQKVEQKPRKALSTRKIVTGGILRVAADGNRLVRGRVPAKAIRGLM